MNHLNSAKRPKIVTEKFEILTDLCDAFDQFSGSERKTNLIGYLKHNVQRETFSHRDAVSGNYYEDPEDDKE